MRNTVDWISVSEKLPEEHEDVLVYYYSNRDTLYFPNARYMKETSFYKGKFECDEEVSHWSLLPDPPTNA
jgi:hypothetical protein